MMGHPAEHNMKFCWHAGAISMARCSHASLLSTGNSECCCSPAADAASSARQQTARVAPNLPILPVLNLQYKLVQWLSTSLSSCVAHEHASSLQVLISTTALCRLVGALAEDQQHCLAHCRRTSGRLCRCRVGVRAQPGRWAMKLWQGAVLGYQENQQQHTYRVCSEVIEGLI